MTTNSDMHQYAKHEAEAKDTGVTKDTRLGPGDPPDPSTVNDQISPRQESPDLENESSDDEYDKG